MSEVSNNTNSALINVVIVEDDPFFTKSISIFFKYKPRFNLIGKFVCCEEAIESDILDNAQILLLDIKLPRMSGLEALPIFQKKFPDLQIIILSSVKDDEFLFEAIQKGASGFILKQDYVSHLENAIEQVMLGGMLFSPIMAQKILTFFKPKPINRYNLTRRENEVLQFLRQGMMKKEIADKLNISYNTVDTHVKHIYKKMHVSSNIQASLLANDMERKNRKI